MPVRIQRSRRKGWRMPEGAVYVGRPTKWGNPFLVSDIARRFPSLTVDQCAQTVVNDFRHRLVAALERPWTESHDIGFRVMAETLDELRGKDLACWCHLRSPCHADVLLELANGEGGLCASSGALTCTHDGRPAHPWEPGESCPPKAPVDRDAMPSAEEAHEAFQAAMDRGEK